MPTGFQCWVAGPKTSRFYKMLLGQRTEDLRKMLLGQRTEDLRIHVGTYYPETGGILWHSDNF